jgi:hypothetical protein
MEAMAKLFIDFLAEYGVLATVVFIMLFNDRKKSKEQSDTIQSMLKNQAEETKQQNKMITQHGLTIAQLQNNTTAIGEAKAEVEETKAEVTDLKDIFAKYIEVSTKQNAEKTVMVEAGIDTLKIHTTTIEKQTESVEAMNEQIKTLEDAVRQLLKQHESGVNLSPEAKSDIVRDVAASITTTINDCLNEHLKKITQEAPKVQPETKTIETPKPKAEDKEGKTVDG